MTSDTTAPVARVRNLPDLLGVIPHLLGFHPEESMVLMVVDEGLVQLTARSDLSDLRAAGHLELLIERMLVRWPGAKMWAVAYARAEDAGWALLERAREHLGDGLAGDPICVSGDRFRVGDRGGPAFRHDPATSTTAAAATVHGLQARPSRECIATLLQADPRDAGEAEDAWVRSLGRMLELAPDERPGELLRALRVALGDPATASRDDLAWLGLLINDPYARDEAVLSLERSDAESWVELWTRVVRGCPYGTQAQPLAILALAAWVNGDGALHSVCLEEMDAQGVEPGLKRMLEHLNLAIVPPSDWDELRVRFRELLEEPDEG